MEERNHIATLYVAAPKLMIPKDLRNDIMPRNPEDMGTVFGHVFFGITDDKGNETTYGFHYNREDAARYSGVIYNKKIKGDVTPEEDEPYDDKLVYHITKKQYDAIHRYAEKNKETPPLYNMFTSNCALFAYKALKQADLKLPPQLPVYNPAMAVAGIRILEKASKIKENLLKSVQNIRLHFSSDKTVSKDVLQSLKKKPKMEGIGVRTLVSKMKQR